MNLSKLSSAKRLTLYREARAIIAVAAVTKIGKKPHYEAPHYYVIAKQLGLSERAADLADELYNSVNGPDDWKVEDEDVAMERVQTRIEMEVEA